MKKTSLYLEPEVDHALARIARERGITKADLIRRVLADAVKPVPRPKFSAIGIMEGPGDLSTNTDKYLAEGFGEN